MGSMRRLAAVVAVLGGVALAGPGAGSARAAQPPDPDGVGSDSFVTIVARQCPSYDDIRANRARNNIQESLRDLGLNTPYSAGQPISPAIEDATQPNCDPIVDWRFTLGKGIAGSPVKGPWGHCRWSARRSRRMSPRRRRSRTATARAASCPAARSPG